MKRDPIQPMDDGLMLSLYRHMDAELSAPAVFVADPLEDYRIRHVSASCRLLGVRSDMPLPECMPALTPSKLDQLWSEIGKCGTASVETEFRSAAGRDIAIEIVFSLLEHGERCLMAGYARDIAARKQQALAESRQFLQQVIDTVADPVFVKDRQHRWIWLNQAFCQLMGQPLEALLGKSDFDFFAAEEARVFWDKDELVFTQGGKNVNEELYTDAEGIVHTIITSKTCFTDAHGATILVGSINDITPLKQTQLHLEEAGNRLRSLADNMPDNIARWDTEGRMLFSNPTHQRTLGKPAGELIGKTHIEAFPDDRYRPVDTAIAQVVASGEPVVFVRQLVPVENGEVRIHDIKLVPEFDDAGQVASVLGIGRDMTDIYRMQEAVAAREQEFRSLAENLPDNIGRWDIAGRYIYINPTYERTLGTQAAGVIGKTIAEAFPARRESPAAMAVARVIATGEAVPFVRQLVPAENGEMRIHEVNMVPERDVDGSVIGVLGIGRDMTDIYRMQEAVAAREQEFRSLAENSPNSIIRYDREGRIRYLNAGLARELEVTAADLIGKLPSEVWPDGRFDGIQRAAAQVVEMETEVPIEICNAIAEGEGPFHQIRIVPERNVAGKVIGTIAFGWDITDLKRYAQSLQERVKLEGQLSGLAASVPGFIFTFRLAADRHISFPFASAGIEDLVGFRPQDIRDDVALLHTRYHPDDLPRVYADMKASEQALSPFRIEIRVFHPEHGMRWAEIRSTPQRYEDGSTEWHGIMLDITERKQAEMLVAERERDFRTLAENAPELIIRYDKECRRIYANPAYAKDMGVQRADVANKTPLQFWQPSNVSAENYMAQLRRVMETGESSEVFLEWMSADGRLQYRCLSLVAEYDTDGEPCGALAIGHDIGASRKSEMLATIRMSIFEELAKGGDIREVLSIVADFVEVSSPGLLCSILLVDAEGKHLLTAAAPSLPAFYSEAVNGIAIGEGVGCCGTAAWRGEAVLAEDIYRHPYWKDYRSLAAQAGLAACWSFPLKGVDGMLGTFAVYRRATGLPTEEDMALIREASHLAVISIERKQREEKLMRQASYDILTGLPNRRLFSNRLKEEVTRAERAGHNVGLLFIDLDRFKEVNDNLGHDFGDSLLIEASNRIRRCVRESDSVARLGGDEFVVILPEIEEITHLGRVAQNLLDVMGQAFILGGHSAYVSASIGIACYPADADNMDSLMGCADQAMYAAKELGRNGFSFFTAAMQQQAQQRMNLANDLRDALAYGQLQVYYQPIVDIGSRRVVKAEALLRWHHPVRGMVPPNHFIPIAEEIGIIHEIGEWVFREAANTAKRWREIQGAADCCPLTVACPPQVSVNMSPRQFMRGNVGSTWVEYLHALGLPAEAMVIEITEGLLLGDQSDILEKLERFRAAGMRIALDDFGTGYSAMAYLKKFPIDYLKIDRSFVRDLETDPNDRAIAEAIVVMARKLGLKTIAEGVETESQRNLLAEVGCDYVQGYLYAKPMPVENFLAYTAAIESLFQ
jgi:diguanylate cyclase (GGDEF)-like protein/PAS domain S-box-containing protein